MIKIVLKSADTKTKLVAYYSLVRSKLEYGCQVWDPVLKKYIKIIKKKLKIKHCVIFFL